MIRSTTGMFRWVAVALVVVLASCASGPPPNAQPFQEAPSAPAGYATLYIYRPYDENGKSPGPQVYINGRDVAGLRNGSYSFVFVRPGTYTVATRPGGSGAARGLTAEIVIPGLGEHFLLFDRAYGQRMVFDAASFTMSPAVNKLHERWTLQSRNEAIFSISRCYLLPARLERLE
jgi:hypothetical protein